MAVVHHIEPLVLELPFHRYFECVRDQPYAFLLDSALPSEAAQSSYIGADPFLIYRAKRRGGPEDGAHIQIERHDGARPRFESRVAPLFDDLRAVFEEHTLGRDVYEDTPYSFQSGAVGWFGYEVAHMIEQLPDTGVDDVGLADVMLMFVDVVLAHDHTTGATHLSILGRGHNEVEARAHAERARTQWIRRIRDFEAQKPEAWAGPQENLPLIDVNAAFTQRAYERVVEDAKEHIFAGDVFEVCTTYRMDAPFSGDAWVLYQELRRINPAPYAVFLKLPDAEIVSSSPERFLKLDPDRIAESRPIKGTRARGTNEAEDEALAHALATSEKDRAENMMIVDLVRNDLGRVSKFHSVRVPELMAIETYATVFQMVSTVRGELLDDVDLFDLIRACAPGGSMTGAPKIEAMKIIDALEPHSRGVYAGGIGYLDFSRTLDLNMVIRTAIVKDGHCYFNVGGAVVADSDPTAEYEETLAKAQALLQALSNVAGA